MDSAALVIPSSFVFPTYDSFCASCKSQIFAFPKTLMEYIWLNPKTPKGYQKLIRTCKLMFLKNPIIVTKSLSYHDRDKCEICIDNSRTKIIDANNFISRFWLTEYLYLGSVANNLSLIISKIYKCDVKNLNINRQNLTYNEFKFLTANVETCMLFHAFIKYDDGNNVPFVKRFEVLPKIEKFYSYCFNSIVLRDTVEDLIKIPQFKNIKELMVEDVPEGFNVERLNDFLKENNIYANITLRFTLKYNLSEEYKNRLQTFINKIILQKETLNFVPTRMDFDGMENTAQYHRICSTIYNQHYGIDKNLRFG